MIIQLNTTGTVPIYVQLRNQIVMGIGRGELKIGERLPTVRQLAEDIGVNMMTVTKAYGILKNEGYIEIDRRHGAKVSESAELTSEFREKMESELLLLISETSLKGINQNDFFDICQRIYNNIHISYQEEGLSRCLDS